MWRREECSARSPITLLIVAVHAPGGVARPVLVLGEREQEIRLARTLSAPPRPRHLRTLPRGVVGLDVRELVAERVEGASETGISLIPSWSSTTW